MFPTGWLWRLVAPCILALAMASHVAGVEALPKVEIRGTSFRISLADGRVLTSREMVGAQLAVVTNGVAARVRIDAVEPDPGDPAMGIRASDEVWLHTFSVQGPDGRWSNLCEPGPDGRRQGFPLAGHARPDGTIGPGAPGEFALTCTSGGEGKCVRLGYRPWRSAALADAFTACVHLIAADYAGDGRATTRNGQPIDIYDALGVQEPANDPRQDFEAGWSPRGAVCVRHARVKENVSLAAVEAQTPRLSGRVGTMCTEEYARTLGAILFNRSPP